jgi:PAS domain S-box-containing protein
MSASDALNPVAPSERSKDVSQLAPDDRAFPGCQAASALTAGQLEGILRLLAGAGTGEGADRLHNTLAVVTKSDAGPTCHEQDRDSAKDERIRRAESRYQTLVEQIPAVTFMAALDEGETELYVSPQIESLLGFSQKQWVEDPTLWYRQLHPDDRDRWYTEFAQTCALGAPFRSEYRFVARDGRVVWVHGEAKVVRDESGNPLYLQGIAFDITARKHAEDVLKRATNELELRDRERTAELAASNAELQQEIAERRRAEEVIRRVNADLVAAHERAVEANEVKSTFLANMSHELRTPLNAIIGYSELLQELAAENTARDPTTELQCINRAGRHLLMIINDILDLSKIEADKIELVPEHFAVTELIGEMESTISPLLSANANRLVVAAADVLGTMYTDLTRIRQCLLNLLSNACKFTTSGIIRLEAVRESRPGGDWIIFRVRDNGIGMTAQQVGRLFQAFTQADASTTRKYGGTGLGLAITRRLCRLMAGDVTVESVPGQGSTFSMRVPAVLATDSASSDCAATSDQVP